MTFFAYAPWTQFEPTTGQLIVPKTMTDKDSIEHHQKSGIPLLIRDLRVEQRGCGSQNILLQLREIQHRMHIFQIAADRVRVPDPALQRDILSQESAKIFPDLIQTALDLTLFIPAGCILPPGRKFPAG